MDRAARKHRRLLARNRAVAATCRKRKRNEAVSGLTCDQSPTLIGISAEIAGCILDRDVGQALQSLGAPAGFTAINGGAAATWEPRTIRTASPRSRTSQLKHAAEFPEGHPASAHSLHGTTPYQRLQLHNRALQQAKQESYRMLNNVKADRHPQRSSWPINQDRSPPHQQRCISLQQQAGLRDQLASKAHSITPCQASCENYNSPFSAQAKAPLETETPSLRHCTSPTSRNHCPASSWLSPHASSHSLPFQSARSSISGIAGSFPLNGNSIAALLKDSNADLQARVPWRPSQSASMGTEFEKEVHAQMPWLSCYTRTLSSALSPDPPLTQRMPASRSLEEDAPSDDSVAISPAHRQVWDWTHGPLQNFRALRRAHSDVQEQCQLPQDLPQRRSSSGNLQLRFGDSRQTCSNPSENAQHAQQGQSLSGQQATLSDILAVQAQLRHFSSSASHPSQPCSPSPRLSLNEAAQRAMPQLNASSPSLQSLLPGRCSAPLQQLLHASPPLSPGQHFLQSSQPTQLVSRPSSSARHSSALLNPRLLSHTSSAADQLPIIQDNPPWYSSATQRPPSFSSVPLHVARPPASALQHQDRSSPSASWTPSLPPPWPMVAGYATPSPRARLTTRVANPSPHGRRALASQHASQHAADGRNRHTWRPDGRLMTQGDSILCSANTPHTQCAPQLQDLELQQANFDWMASDPAAISGAHNPSSQL